MEKILNSSIPEFSVVLPIHNQEDIITRVLEGIINNTHGLFEVIIILDACYDNTVSIVKKWYETEFPSNVTRVVLFETEHPLFETKCDNIGFKNAKGDYLLEIQADMVMTEPGYNIHIQKPFKLLDNVIGVSGRCCHNITNKNGVGKVGEKIMKNISELDVDRNIFYVGETCNRGPLLLDSKKVKELGYFDEIHYFHNNSDHDLFTRAFFTHGWICGYVPIDFDTDLRWGSQRKSRNKQNSDEFDKRNQECNDRTFHKYYNRSFYKYYRKIIPRKIYTYKLS